VSGRRVAELGQAPLHLVGDGVQLVAGVDLLAQAGVLGLVALGLGDHPLDLGPVQVAALGDGDLLLGAGVLVAGGDFEDAVGVHVEGDLDLGDAPRRRADVLQPEAAEHPVVGGPLALALQDDHVHRRLVVLGGGEHFGAAGRDRRVALDHLGHDPAEGLQPQRQRGHVQQQHVGALTGQHCGLDGRAQGHHLVGVDGHVGVLTAGEAADQRLHGRDPGRAADQDHLVQVVGGHLGVAHRLLHRPQAALDQVLGELLELGPGEGGRQVFGPGGVGSDERQVDLGLGHRGQLDLGLLGRLEQPLQGLGVVAQVDAVLALELVGQVVDQPAVEVVAAQVGVAGGRPDLDDPVPDVEDAHVEGPAAEVEHHHGLVLALVQSVGERGCGRLVDDAQDLQPGDLPGVLGRLPLGVVEVGGDGDHRLGDPLPQELAGVLGQLAQHQGADLLGRVQLAAHVEAGHAVRSRHDVERDRPGLAGHLVVASADEPLGRGDRPLGVEDRLPPGQLPDQPLPLVGERHYRGGRARPFRVGDHRRVAGLQDRDHRVGRTQVDTHGLSHVSPLSPVKTGRVVS